MCRWAIPRGRSIAHLQTLTARASSLLQRMIDPEEIAILVASVASPLSSATNGAALRVEGGLLATIA
ncbi:hypothetical protein [Rhodospirillum rubrum]|uniref:hypothetical protein n=1 Tax=Rhodospirillum rubrum TaxID=1085 RepID=UPI001904672A|nr:hypothetical protein [Rhodospirillum rubrum]